MLHLKDATFVDWKSLKVSKGHFHVSSDKVTAVKRIPAGAKTVDCTGLVATRSFVIGHHHIYSALARGMKAPRKTPRNFREILQYVWWNLDKKLDAKMVRASALVAAVEAAKSGATFIIDHHASPNAVRGSLHDIAAAFDAAGVGHLLCYELSDRDGRKSREAALRETDEYLQTRQGLVGLHASFTVGDSLLKDAVALAGKHHTGLHVHVSEADSDKGALTRFSNAGALDSPATLLAHGLHLSDAERGLFRKSKAWFVQNSESNWNNGVGEFSGRGLGERVFLGTDGMHGDMIASAKAAFLLAQSQRNAAFAEAYLRLRRAHQYLSSNGFRGDGEGDLVLLDYPLPTPLTSANFLGHFYYGLSRAHVRHVVRGGRLLVKDRRMTTLDEDAVYAQAREQAARLWRRL